MRFTRLAVIAGVISYVGCSHRAPSVVLSPTDRFLQAQPSDAQAYLRAKSDLMAATARYRAAEAAWEEAGRPAVLQQALEPFRADLEQARARFELLDAALIETLNDSMLGAPEEALPSGVWVHALLVDDDDQEETTIRGVTIELDGVDNDDGTCCIVVRRFDQKTTCDGLRTGDEVLTLGRLIRISEVNSQREAVHVMVRETQGMNPT